jgi:hypothetical protein
MNQLFNTVNYFEFQAFEALRRWKPPGLCIAQAGSRSFPDSYLKLVRYPRSLAPTLVTSDRDGNKKAADAFLRAAAFG